MEPEIRDIAFRHYPARAAGQPRADVPALFFLRPMFPTQATKNAA